jgi:hypothetical protein
MAREGADAEAAVRLRDPGELRDAMDRDERLGQRRLPLARADDEVRPARDGTRAVRESREGVLYRGCLGECRRKPSLPGQEGGRG